MPDSAAIIQGSYKNFPIFWKRAKTEGGRELVIKQFPDRATQSVEDTGQIPIDFQLDLVCADIGSADYAEYKSNLLRTLNTEGAGVFIHPLFGRVDNVYSGRWSINEDTSNYGNTLVTVPFFVSDNIGIPQSAGVTLGEVQELRRETMLAVAADVTANYSVSTTFPSNYTDAVSNLTDFADEAQELSSLQGVSSGANDSFLDKLGKYRDSFAANVLNAAGLVNDTIDLIDTGLDLYENPQKQLKFLAGFFGFGSSDVAILQNTVSRVQRLRNRKLFNDSINAIAISYAYESVSSITFDTVNDVESVRQSLDDQFEAVQSSTTDQTVKDAISNQREAVLLLLDEAQLNASQIISIETQLTSTRLLSFAYYANEDNAQTIADLNDIKDVSYISGELDIVTA